jgi:diadenosine tetraphosphate (Ap4A) HIT family hydrolase
MSGYLNATSSIERGACVLCNPESELRERDTFSVDVVSGARLVSDDLLCAPDVAPIVPGHTLVFPRAHQTSFADACAAGASWSTVVHGIDRIAAAIRGDADDVLAFEHGSPTPWRPAASGKCGSTEHAHIHLVPCSAGTAETLVTALVRTLGSAPVGDSDVAALVARPNGYLWIWSVAARRNVVLVPSAGAIPSQLVRRTLTDLIYDEPARGIRRTWSDLLFFAPHVAAAEQRACHNALAVVGPTVGDSRHVC